MKCRVCGEELLDSSNFCSKCGTPCKDVTYREKTSLTKETLSFQAKLLMFRDRYGTMGIIFIVIVAFLPSFFLLAMALTPSENSEFDNVKNENHISSQQVVENKPIIEEIYNISDVSYLELYQNYSQYKEGTWIRIAGRVSSVGKNISNTNYLTIREYLPENITTSIYVNIDKNKASTVKNINQDDFVVIVGKVGSKLSNSINLDSAYIEKSGDDSYKKTIELLSNSAILIDAKDLIQAYNENVVKADGIYKDKILIVNGVINNIGKDILDNVYITLNANNKVYFSNVRGEFVNQSEIDKLAYLSKGENISIMGICTGELATSPTINSCYIITTG